MPAAPSASEITTTAAVPTHVNRRVPAFCHPSRAAWVGVRGKLS
jgi:hypothetical protein